MASRVEPSTRTVVQAASRRRRGTHLISADIDRPDQGPNHPSLGWYAAERAFDEMALSRRSGPLGDHLPS